jgi:hypothetical protein
MTITNIFAIWPERTRSLPCVGKMGVYLPSLLNSNEVVLASNPLAIRVMRHYRAPIHFFNLL